MHYAIYDGRKIHGDVRPRVGPEPRRTAWRVDILIPDQDPAYYAALVAECTPRSLLFMHEGFWKRGAAFLTHVQHIKGLQVELQFCGAGPLIAARPTPLQTRECCGTCAHLDDNGTGQFAGYCTLTGWLLNGKLVPGWMAGCPYWQQQPAHETPLALCPRCAQPLVHGVCSSCSFIAMATHE